MEIWPTTLGMNSCSKGQLSKGWPVNGLTSPESCGDWTLSYFLSLRLITWGQEWLINECIGVGLDRDTKKRAKRSHKATEIMIKQEPRGTRERRGVSPLWGRRETVQEQELRNWVTNSATDGDYRLGYQSHMCLEVVGVTFSWSQQCSYRGGFCPL